MCVMSGTHERPAISCQHTQEITLYADRDMVLSMDSIWLFQGLKLMTCYLISTCSLQSAEFSWAET